MKSNRHLTCLIIWGSLASAIFPSVARANALRLADQDAEIVARGEAGVASVNSPAAMYYNPAGLGHIRSAEIQDGVFVLFPDITYRSPTGREVKEGHSSFYQPHFFAAVPINSNLTFGLAAYSPYGQGTSWSNDSGFAGLATTNDMRYITGAAGLAWSEGNFSIGATLQWSHARIDLNRLTALAPGFVTNFRYLAHADGATANIGMQWTPADGHHFGLLYQRKTDMQFSGTASLAGVASAQGTTGWVFPDNVTLGYDWEFSPTWDLEVMWDWTNWERVNTLFLSAGPLSTALPLNWKSSSYYAIGLSKTMGPWKGSIGYEFSQSSVRPDFFSPSLPDTDRNILSGGVFYKQPRYEAGILLQRSLPHSITTTGVPDGLGGSDAGTFKNAFWGVDFTVALKF